MGVRAARPDRNSVILQATEINQHYFSGQTFKHKSGRMRGAVMMAGPMLARFGKAKTPRPGGEKIGRRRLDTHIRGLEQLGAQFSYDGDQNIFSLSCDHLKGARIL